MSTFGSNEASASRMADRGFTFTMTLDRISMLRWALIVSSIWLGLASTGAQAAPFHPFLAGSSLSGFDHACGTAVDNKGDVYISSAAESKIKVYNAAHVEVTSITDNHEPCALAVDSRGELFVSERGTGNVVRFQPNSYPFSGIPTYGSAEPVGESGGARGISVDSADDSLYVAKGNRIEFYRSEVQEIQVRNATAGTYKLRFKGEETAPLAFNASDAAIQAALETLPGIGSGNVSVSAGTGGSGTHKIAFTRARSFTDETQVTILSSLSGNTVEEVTVAATAGTYKLSFEGEETAPIPFNAPANQGEGAGSVEATLEALPNVASGDVSVTGGPGDTGGTHPYVVTFEGAYAAKNVGFLAADPSGLTGSVSVSRSPGVESFATTVRSGGRGADETQPISVTHALSGTYKLSFEGEETAPIPFNAPANKGEGVGSVEAALENLGSISPGDVTVFFGGSPTFDERVYNVGFSGTLAARDLPQIETASTLSPNEVQEVTVAATAGTYTLTSATASGTGATMSGSKTVTGVDATYGTFHVGDVIEGEGIPQANGVGNLTAGSKTVSGAEGAFVVGQMISGTGIPAGTTITAVGVNTLTLSAAATASGTFVLNAVTTVATAGTTTLELSAVATATTSERPLRAFETTAPIVFNAPANKGEGAGSLEAALEALNGIESGDVSVSGGPGDAGGTHPYVVNFEGAFARHNIRPIVAKPAALTGTVTVATKIEGAEVSGSTRVQGFGNIGEGEFTDASGVASYTSQGAESFHRRRYISVADGGADEIEVFAGNLNSGSGDLEPGTLHLRATIDGAETPAGELGLAGTGAYLGVDPGNVDPLTHKCAPIGAQDCTGGHIFAYDSPHSVVNEFEATGKYFTQIGSPEPPFSFEDAMPTAIAVDRSGGTTDGRIYVTAGASGGAHVLAFGAVTPPSRSSLGEPTSQKFPGACGTVVDSQGDLYVAGKSMIRIYDQSGSEIAGIPDPQQPCYLAVDSEGNLYARDEGSSSAGDERVALFEPKEYPFSGPPEYGSPQTIDTSRRPPDIAVDPSTGRLFVARSENPGVFVYKSAQEGSGLLVSGFCGFASAIGGIDVYGANGDVYIATGHEIVICNKDGSKVLARIDGSGSPGGAFGETMNDAHLAVDQANGHVLIFESQFRGQIEEFEASGAFVARYGPFTKTGEKSDLAVDNSCALQEPPLAGATCESFDPNNSRLYLAYDAPAGFDLTAFSPLNYGEPPLPKTGTASGFGPSSATLNGTVDPLGFEVEECAFEWGEAGQPYEHTEPCAEDAEQIGDGHGPVPVHLNLSGISPETTVYHFRLVAKNEFGEKKGTEVFFGPLQVTTNTARPILYREATLRGTINPSGLATEYHFEYLTQAQYEADNETFVGAQSTPTETLAASAGASDVEAFLVGLEEGTAYRFRLVAKNAVSALNGTERVFETLERPTSPPCPNATLRLENGSTRLPDCRAYELVSPPDTRGATPFAAEGGGSNMFNNWLVTPSGSLAGESLAFFLNGTLPGFEGNGGFDAYRSTRRSTGWGTEIFSPTLAEGGRGLNLSGLQTGISSDQLYSGWDFRTSPGGTLTGSTYLRTPKGFEVLGQGSLGTDPQAESRFIVHGGSHVIFTSNQHLEDEEGNEAAPAGTMAIYDRPAGVSHARVVSLKPDGSAFGAGEGATYEGATEDGSDIVFRVGGSLYVRRDGTDTFQISTGGTFAGISDSGGRVFYTTGGTLYLCDTDAGPCVGGPEPPGRSEIAESGKFVNVSADGSHVYFTSEEEFGGEGEGGEHNLYVWDEAAIHLVAVLDPEDLFQSGQIHFPGTRKLSLVALDSWVECVQGVVGRASCPSRTTPSGRFFVFQSHADLTPTYEAQGHSEIFRYDAEGHSLLCVSCDPSGAPAEDESDLQPFGNPAPTKGQTLVPNVTEDGNRVAFQTMAPLLPEDANSVLDLYEWQVQGIGGCKRAKGCLALISSGQGSDPSYIYSMAPDGHDIFLLTLEKLVGSDIAGSPSIYDARVEGGFPQPRSEPVCQGDACQPPPGSNPEGAVAATAVPNGGNSTIKRHPCPKGRRSVARNGKVHCVKRRHNRKHSRRHTRGPGR